MSARARILVVEDEPRLAEILRLYLERDGHRVTVVGDGRAAIEAFDRDPVDLVVLDLMLPGVGGEAVLGAIRERGDTPVLIASAKRSDLERISGLRMGADDYLAKPFNPHELTARVAAVLRRSRGTGPDDRGRGSSTRPRASCRSTPAGSSSTPASRRYTRRRRRARPDGSAVRGPPDAGRARPARRARPPARARCSPATSCSRPSPAGPDEVYDRVIDVHVANLRRKLGDDAARPWLIETIPQTGYRLVASRDPDPRERHGRGPGPSQASLAGLAARPAPRRRRHRRPAARRGRRQSRRQLRASRPS